MQRRSLVTAGALLLALAPVAGAQVVVQGLDVHGYGSWSYGRTTDNLTANQYLFGHGRGDYSHVEAAINLSAAVSDRLTVTVQPFWHSGHHANQTASGIDYAFAEWRFSDAARLRVGSVKHPFGIYTEVFDVGTVRPFASLPQGIYGPSGMIGKAYSGMGLTGVRFAESGWGVGYDVYAGGLDVFENDVPLQVLREGADTTGKTINYALTRTFRDVVGGRGVLHTPVAGLSFGGSAYSGTRPLPGGETRRTVYAAHGEYLTDRWQLRTELGRADEADRQVVTGSYAEAAYRLTTAWQLAGLWSRQRTTLEGVDVSRAPSLLEHDEWGVGLNYWFAPNLVVKVSYHAVEGNRFAFPEPSRVRALVAGGRIEPTTDVVLVGGQFSF